MVICYPIIRGGQMDFIAEYLEKSEGTSKFPTLKLVLTRFGDYMDRYNGTISDLTPRDISAFFQQNSWVNSSTFYNQRNILVQFFKWLASQGIPCDPEVVSAVKFPSINKSSRYANFFSSFEEMIEEIRYVFFMGDPDAHREGEVVILSAIGLSSSDTAALRFKQVDFDQRTIQTENQTFEEVKSCFLDCLRDTGATSLDYVIKPFRIRASNKPRSEGVVRHLIRQANERWRSAGHADSRVSPQYARYSYLFLKLWEHEQQSGYPIRCKDDHIMDLIRRWTGVERNAQSARYSLIRDYEGWKKEFDKW